VVQCKKCGFLAVRHPDNGLVEIEAEPRSTGIFPTPLFNTRSILCIVNAANLREEVKMKGGTTSEAPRVVLPVIEAERDCPQFRAWLQGFSPKEHVDMMHTEMLRKEIEDRRIADEQRAEQRRKDDEKRADDRLTNDRAWQKKQEDKRQKWQTDQEYTKYRRTILIGVLLALFGAALTIATDPWKTKSDPPQIIVNPDRLKLSLIPRRA